MLTRITFATDSDHLDLIIRVFGSLFRTRYLLHLAISKCGNLGLIKYACVYKCMRGHSDPCTTAIFFVFVQEVLTHPVAVGLPQVRIPAALSISMLISGFSRFFLVALQLEGL